MGRIRLPTGGRRFAVRVHEVTGGNPFYVIELLRTLFTQGWLTADATSANGSRPRPAARPPRSPWRRRCTTPSPSGSSRCLRLHDLLLTIALAGGGCQPDLLSHVHGISRLRAATMADGLVERYLAVEENGAYRPAHPVIARVVRHGVTTSRRREVHRTIALGLELLASRHRGRPRRDRAACGARRGAVPGVSARAGRRRRGNGAIRSRGGAVVARPCRRMRCARRGVGRGEPAHRRRARPGRLGRSTAAGAPVLRLRRVSWNGPISICG